VMFYVLEFKICYELKLSSSLQLKDSNTLGFWWHYEIFFSFVHFTGLRLLFSL